MNILASTVDTPDGAFTIVMTEGVVIASGWTTDVAHLVELIHQGMRPAVGDVADTAEGDTAMAAARAAVVAYYDGDLSAPLAVPVRQQSGEFRMRAWEVLRRVEAGRPITYAEFAVRAGSPAAVRAAATACAQNAAALFVPCHRVLRSDGTPGGFRYGLDLKKRLLQREAERARRQLPGR